LRKGQANGWLHRQKRDLAGKCQKAKKASGVNPAQKRRTTPLLSGASGVRRGFKVELLEQYYKVKFVLDVQ